MIAHVSGVVAEKFLNSVIVDVHGIGYEVALTSPDFDTVKVGDEKKYYTYHNVYENGEDLYGFSSLAAKKLFELLISVNGIGPKAGLSIMSLGSPEDVRNAIANSDAKFISGAAGVGKKSAERVIVDLHDKVGDPSSLSYAAKATKSVEEEVQDDALDALIALGFPLKEATAALKDVDPNLSVEERIREALKQR